MHLLYYLSVFTVSFDTFLTFDLEGFNFRLSQLALIPILLSVLLKALLTRKLRIPLGFFWLIAWAGFIFLFIPNTNYLPRNLGYAFWLVLNILLILVTVNLFRTEERVLQLLRVYLLSFAFVAAFGLVQFALGVLGFTPPLVTMWWFPRFPRLNGFSYEPSYFSTYLLTGWILSAYFYQTKTRLFSHKLVRTTLIFTSLGMLLSSSRMGWLMMGLWLMQHPLKLIYGFYTRLRVDRVSLNYSKGILVLVIPLLFFSIRTIGVENITFLVEGLGIAEQGGHSSEARSQNLEETLQVFLESPIIGYSLGGISPAIGRLRAVEVDSNELAKENEGMSVFAEVLAASGILGVIPFLVYFGVLIRRMFLRSRASQDPEIRKIAKGLAYALCFELAILQFNQNILRPYLWLQIAIFSSFYGAFLTRKKFLP